MNAIPWCWIAFSVDLQFEALLRRRTNYSDSELKILKIGMQQPRLKEENE